MTHVQQIVSLSNGLKIHSVGFGVYRSPPGSTTVDSVVRALQAGYRHIDTAQVYGNEADVGEAIKQSSLKREEIFVTSKIPQGSFEDARNRILESVHKIGGGYIDLMLLHSPGNPESRLKAWRVMEELHQQGILKSIGVSNFGVGHLEKLLSNCKVRPVVNQIELHPWLQWKEVEDYCKSQSIYLEAYSPLAKALTITDPLLLKIAAEVNKTPAQVLIRWSLQRGYITLPKSNTPSRIVENIQVFDFALNDTQMSTLNGLDKHMTTGWNPIENDPV